MNHVKFIYHVKGIYHVYRIYHVYGINHVYGIIHVYGIEYLRDALENEISSDIKAAACYSLGQIGRHSPKHANKVSENNTLNLMVDLFNSKESTDDLKSKAKRSLRKIIKNCDILQFLEPLLKKAPAEIMNSILTQYKKHLKNTTQYKKDFVENGCLKILQDLKLNHDYNDELRKIIDEVCFENYDRELVNFYSPTFKQELEKKFYDELN